MYVGKTLFALLMDCLPWTALTRIIARYRDNHRGRMLPCIEHFSTLSFAPLTYRESLLDIEARLSAKRLSCTTWIFARQ